MNNFKLKQFMVETFLSRSPVQTSFKKNINFKKKELHKIDLEMLERSLLIKCRVSSRSMVAEINILEFKIYGSWMKTSALCRLVKRETKL